MEKVDARRRVYEFLDTVDGDPTRARGRAVRCCEMALNLYAEYGDMAEARGLLRGGLMQRDADYGSIYRGWIAMEADHAGNVDFARALFADWRALCGDEDGGFWCRYIAFEARHGGARRARCGRGGRGGVPRRARGARQVRQAGAPARPRGPRVRRARPRPRRLRLGRRRAGVAGGPGARLP